ncbi:conjugal transfer relaxosome DNA-bindin protein TraY [Escherichia coli]|uniref:conjugal transfer relaxosome DNA-bindin protein TraY n=1 Tax=Escherichia coli TaxID=562 RepID=UPI003DA25D62
MKASNRSGKKSSFEAVIRLKDHLHRLSKVCWAGNIYGKSLVKYLTMRLDDEITSYLLQQKIVVDGVKQMRLQTGDHLIKFPDFYARNIQGRQ